jgi:hypothetical protein
MYSGSVSGSTFRSYLSGISKKKISILSIILSAAAFSSVRSFQRSNESELIRLVCCFGTRKSKDLGFGSEYPYRTGIYFSCADDLSVGRCQLNLYPAQSYRFRSDAGTSVPDPDSNPEPPDPYVFQQILGLLDPLVRGMGPDPDPSIILISSCKNSKKKLYSYCFVTSFKLFMFVRMM